MLAYHEVLGLQVVQQEQLNQTAGVQVAIAVLQLVEKLIASTTARSFLQTLRTVMCALMQATATMCSTELGTTATPSKHSQTMLVLLAELPLVPKQSPISSQQALVNRLNKAVQHSRALHQIAISSKPPATMLRVLLEISKRGKVAAVSQHSASNSSTPQPLIILELTHTCRECTPDASS